MVAQIDDIYWKNHKRCLYARLLSYALFEGRPVTTKGQWINPFIFGHFKIEKKLPMLRTVTSPVYIIGTGRSGTTVLGVVFSVHRDVGFLNEPKAMWNSIYDNEDVIGSYSDLPGRYRLNGQDATSDVVNAAHKLYGAYSFFVCKKRVVDKYPEMIFRVPFVSSIFPDAKFIFLTRNGWDACASITNWSQRKGEIVNGSTHDWWGVDQRKWKLIKSELIKTDLSLSSIHELVDAIDDHRVMAAVEWIVTMREGLRASVENPHSVMTLPYEALVAEPRASLIKLFDFCNLQHDEDCISYAEKSLKPVAPYPEFDMPGPLRLLFDETMQMLGYDVVS